MPKRKPDELEEKQAEVIAQEKQIKDKLKTIRGQQKELDAQGDEIRAQRKTIDKQTRAIANQQRQIAALIFRDPDQPAEDGYALDAEDDESEDLAEEVGGLEFPRAKL